MKMHLPKRHCAWGSFQQNPGRRIYQNFIRSPRPHNDLLSLATSVAHRGVLRIAPPLLPSTVPFNFEDRLMNHLQLLSSSALVGAPFVRRFPFHKGAGIFCLGTS